MEPNSIVVPVGGAVTVEVALRAHSHRLSWRDLTDVYVRNSGFSVSAQDPAGEAAFGWTQQTSGGSSRIDRSAGRYGPSLRMEGSVPPATVRQEIPVGLDLRSGPYRALAWVRTSEDFTPDGGSVRLLAVDESGAAVAVVDTPVPPAGDWKLIQTGSLAVGQTRASGLRIELSGSVSGTVWFDEIRLETAGER
jgi:hypothetical protein